MAGETKALLVISVLLMCIEIEGKPTNDVIEGIGGGPGCKPIKCDMLTCPYGNEFDINGCHTCNCRDLPANYKVNYACPMPMCSQRCKYGRQVIKGCETCQCNKPGVPMKENQIGL